MCVFGTRPELIKMVPVIHSLKEHSGFEVTVLSTAQHREMLDHMLAFFNIKTDIDLNIMEKGQTLPQLTAKLPVLLDQTLEKVSPDFVLTQGDTTTAFMVSLASFYRKIPVGHVEAGLRSFSFENPFPEEMNRVLISRISTLNFAPTVQAKENLLKEGCDESFVHVTGNTVIDTLNIISSKELPLDPRVDPGKKLILVTAHRRESHGQKLNEICEALKILADRNENIQILYPVHPHPRVKLSTDAYLKGHSRILLTEPLDYLTFVGLMKHATLILTDSGGVQEEAPTLQTPVLVLRETTERPEGVNAGAAKVIGRKKEGIVSAVETLLHHPKAYNQMIVNQSPYGDGKASERILNILEAYFSVSQSALNNQGCKKTP